MITTESPTPTLAEIKSVTPPPPPAPEPGTGPGTTPDNPIVEAKTDLPTPPDGSNEDAINNENTSLPKEITKTEIELVGEHILQSELRSFGDMKKDNSHKEVQALIDADTTGRMQVLNDLFWAHMEKPSLIPNTDGKAIFTVTEKAPPGATKGVVVEVLGITKFADGTFTCTARVDGSERTDYPLSQDQVQTALLTRDGAVELISGSLPESEQKALKLYVDMKKNGDTLPSTVTQEEARKILSEAVESTGLISGGDLKLLLKNYYDKLISDARDNKALVKEYGDLRDSILTDTDLDLDGTIVADGGLIARILARTGAVSPAAVGQIVGQCNAEIKAYKGQLADKNTPSTERKSIERELTRALLEKKMILSAQDATSESAVSQALTTLMKNGTNMKTFRDAVQTADTDTLIGIVLKHDPSDKEISDDVRRQHREQLAKKLGKTGGLMALAMAIMMYTAMKGGQGQGQ